MIFMPGQPRRDEASDVRAKRPGVNRKQFPSPGVIPGEGKSSLHAFFEQQEDNLDTLIP